MAKIRFNIELSINTENTSDIDQKELIKKLGDAIFDEDNVKKYLNKNDCRVIGIRITNEEGDTQLTEIF